MTAFINKDTELFFLWSPFHNELAKLLKLIDRNKSNDYNRVYVRSLFSMIEGISYRIRQILLQRYNNSEISLKVEQVIALNEISVELKDNGTYKATQKNYKFENLFRFTYKTYCDIYNKEEILNKYIKDNRYSLFKKAINIRNRVTHPKSGKDIFISGSEISILQSVLEW